MTFEQNPELFWLAIVTTATGLMWMPHILQLIVQEGLFRAVYDPARDIPHKAVWAQRARRAHGNAVENLAAFAPLAILVAATGAGSALTTGAAAVFVAARLGHFVVYTLGIPILRVLLFLVGWACQMILALRVFGLV